MSRKNIHLGEDKTKLTSNLDINDNVIKLLIKRKVEGENTVKNKMRTNY